MRTKTVKFGLVGHWVTYAFSMVKISQQILIQMDILTLTFYSLRDSEDQCLVWWSKWDMEI
jgi:hypothetical protein